MTRFDNQRGDTASISLLVALFFVACITVMAFTGAFDKRQQPTKLSDNPPKAVVEQLNYHGSVLECINFGRTEKVGGNSFVCDFDGYYAREQLNEPIEPDKDTPKAYVVKVRYQGETLECVQIERANTDVRSASCDFVAYHRD